MPTAHEQMIARQRKRPKVHPETGLAQRQGESLLDLYQRSRQGMPGENRMFFSELGRAFTPPSVGTVPSGTQFQVPEMRRAATEQAFTSREIPIAMGEQSQSVADTGRLPATPAAPTRPAMANPAAILAGVGAPASVAQPRFGGVRGTDAGDAGRHGPAYQEYLRQAGQLARNRATAAAQDSAASLQETATAPAMTLAERQLAQSLMRLYGDRGARMQAATNPGTALPNTAPQDALITQRSNIVRTGTTPGQVLTLNPRNPSITAQQARGMGLNYRYESAIPAGSAELAQIERSIAQQRRAGPSQPREGETREQLAQRQETIRQYNQNRQGKESFAQYQQRRGREQQEQAARDAAIESAKASAKRTDAEANRVNQETEDKRTRPQAAKGGDGADQVTLATINFLTEAYKAEVDPKMREAIRAKVEALSAPSPNAGAGSEAASPAQLPPPDKRPVGMEVSHNGKRYRWNGQAWDKI